MPDSATETIHSAFEALYRQHSRLLRIDTALGPDALMVERMSGREAVSEGFEFHIDCLATSAHLAIAALRGQPVTLRLARPAGERVWPATAFEADWLGSDGGLARYRVLAVEHAAANNLGANLAHLLERPDIEPGSYRNRFVCVPDHVPVVPSFIPTPRAPGRHSARVVGVPGHALTSTRDHCIKVQFHWQRGQRPTTPAGYAPPTPKATPRAMSAPRAGCA